METCAGRNTYNIYKSVVSLAFTIVGNGEGVAQAAFGTESQLWEMVRLFKDRTSHVKAMCLLREVTINSIAFRN